MIKKIMQSMLALLIVVGLGTANASAVSSYNGTTITPTNGTYPVSAVAGDAVTLSSVAGLGNLTVTFKNNASGTIEVKESGATRPAGVPTNPSGLVSKYFEISLQGLSNADISGAKFTFTVDKVWLTNNGVTAANVILQHFGTAWENLTTREVSSTATTVTFEATITSFSPFAVTAVQGLSTTGSPYVLGAFIAAGVLAVVVGTFLASRRRAATNIQ